MEDRKKSSLLHKIAILLFIIYVAMLCYFLFFAESLDRNYINRMYQYNVIPFKEIRRFWIHRDVLDTWAVILNLMGNIVAFIPFGMFLPALFHKCQKFFLTLLFTMEISLCVEVIQLICKVGIMDVDDIILNTAGGVIGFLLYWVLSIFWRKINETEKK